MVLEENSANMRIGKIIITIAIKNNRTKLRNIFIESEREWTISVKAYQFVETEVNFFLIKNEILQCIFLYFNRIG